MGSKKRHIVVIIISFILVFAYLPFLFHEKAKIDEYPKGKETTSHSEEVNEYVALLEDPHIAGQVRLELIRNAKETIEISYHTFSEGIYSSLFVDELIEAANRGVKIRFINDGIIGGFPFKARKTAKALAGYENITIGLYEPFNLNPYSWHNRLHDKYLLVDGKYLITGGRNISDKTFMPEGFSFPVVYDRDILIIGEKDKGIMKDLDEYINTLWSEPFVKIVKGKANPEHIEKLRKEAEKNKIEHQELCKKPDMLKFFKVDSITLLSNPMGRGSKEPVIWEELISLMQNSNGDIIMQSPYTILFNEQIEQIKALDKDISLYTNSIKTSPNIPAYPHYLRQRHKFDDFIDIYEYAGKGSIHTKCFIIGDDISVITSFNIDPRSYNLDTETAYVIESKEFNSYLREITKAWEGECIKRSDGEIKYPDSYKNSIFIKLKTIIFYLFSVFFIPLTPLV